MSGGSNMLVLGADAEWDRARHLFADADVTVFHTMEGVTEMGLDVDALAPHRLVDIYDKWEQLECVAWDWAGTLMQRLGQDIPLDAAAQRVARRNLFIGTLYPVASARERAERIRPLMTTGVRVVSHGLDTVDGVALQEAAASTGVELLGDSIRGSGDTLDVPRERVSSRVRALARGARLALVAARESRRDSGQLRRAIDSARQAGGAALGDGPLVAVHVGVPAHMRALRSAIDALRSRGWRIQLVDMSHQGVMGTDAIRFWEFYRVGARARAAAADPGAARVTTLVRHWADEQGLGAFADRIARDVIDACFVVVPGLVAAHEALQAGLEQHLSLTVNETAQPGAVEACAVAGRTARIPTVNVQHGVITASKRRADFDFDAFCVFGDGYATMLERLGTPSEAIRVVGNPTFDRPVASNDGSTTDAGRTRNRLGIPSGEFVVMFAAQHRNDTLSDLMLYRSMRIALLGLALTEGTRLLVKWHPLGEGSEHGYLVALDRNATVPVTVTRDVGLDAAILASDCVCLLSSTVGFEAAALKRPVIVINPTDSPDPVPFVESGTALRARTPQEFARAVTALRAGPVIDDDAYAHLDELFHSRGDGRAGERIADVCEELVRAVGR